MWGGFSKYSSGIKAAHWSPGEVLGSGKRARSSQRKNRAAEGRNGVGQWWSAEAGNGAATCCKGFQRRWGIGAPLESCGAVTSWISKLLKPGEDRADEWSAAGAGQWIVDAPRCFQGLLGLHGVEWQRIGAEWSGGAVSRTRATDRSGDSKSDRFGSI
ncbi:hypothetical protein FGB62_112g015 [Gracilaria domingensis]|nr:hypothetical protein FGB62_112g015 [Gracilaria domingensis]